MSPGQRDPDIARFSTWEIQDLGTEAVTVRLQLLLIKFVGALSVADQSARPIRVAIVNGAPAVGAQFAWKGKDLKMAVAALCGNHQCLAQAILGVSLDLPVHERLLQLLAFVGASLVSFKDQTDPFHF